ncbi:DUF190 domain-containing protein [Ferviditalea candida]|uniref:DUF190 domain-containing protein n=1 Tax=Ferviditalea candida TaxID=3108399 RepID=A0ABU5ZMW2_9BACL|nr:DUF190 domain-containing protein [Paenibacillaceae bacterium T2]
MNSSKWIQIIVGEFEGQGSGLLYWDITRNLLEDKFRPVFLTRADKGIGEKNEIRTQTLESMQFNNLPIMIETAGDKEQVEHLVPDLKKKVSHGQLVTVSAYSLLEETSLANEHEYVMLKIYFKEKSSWFGRPLHDELLSLMQKQGLIWSTVKRGIAGFGNDQVISKPGLFSRSQVPIIIECIGPAKVIREMIPEIKSKAKHAWIVVLPLQVIVSQ